MKSLFSLIALIALLFTVTIQAQPVSNPYYGTVPVIAGGTNNLLAATTITNSGLFVGRYDNVAFDVSFTCSDTNVIPLVFSLRPAVVAGRYDVNQLTKQFSVTPNGTTAVTLVTNVACPGIGYWQMTIYNANATTYITNLAVNMSNKK